jgi:uncharacterized protein (TIGR02757 family)
MLTQTLKEFLDFKYQQFNNGDFIQDDPVVIPHRYTLQEDIEIAGFIAASLAWGNRKSIINSCDKIMTVMGNSPFDFVLNYSSKKSKILDGIKHRTFNAFDLEVFILCLQKVYQKHQTLEHLFAKLFHENQDFGFAISKFKTEFLGEFIATRTQKHISNPAINSSAKRLCMYLRWMIRKDNNGVDLGIWNTSITPAILHLPLDVHTGNISRKLGLLSRSQNDWKAVMEVTEKLREFCPEDPIKYDFALFGLGAIEKFE